MPKFKNILPERNSKSEFPRCSLKATLNDVSTPRHQGCDVEAAVKVYAHHVSWKKRNIRFEHRFAEESNGPSLSCPMLWISYGVRNNHWSHGFSLLGQKR
jgi:hypothetical protein